MCIMTTSEKTLLDRGIWFGDIAPAPKGIPVPEGEVWRLYGNILGRRYTEVRKGRISTAEFIAQWSLCKTSEERAAAFGGMLPGVDENQPQWATPFTYPVLTPHGVVLYTYGYCRTADAWVFAASVNDAAAEEHVATLLGSCNRQAKSREGAVELGALLASKLFN